MRFSSCIKVCVVIMGVWLVVYYSWILLSIYIESTKFDINKYKNVNFFLYNDTRSFSFAYNLLPETDYNQLNNLTFEFSIINFVCKNTKPFLLILIHSAPTNFAKRRAIRDTWGRNDEDVKVLFLMGSSSEKQENIRMENNLHKDIIQGSFLDTYKNLTYKHTMALKYVVYHCAEIKYVLKTDDDVFVNLPLLKNFLNKDLSPFGAEKLMMGSVIRKPRVYRSYRSKWRVSFDEYPYRYYPKFCLGWAIIYSPDIIFDLYKEAQRATYYWIDDVFITGMMASKINFHSHVEIFPLMMSERELRSVIKHPHDLRPFLFGSADMKETDIRSLWKYVVNNPVPESIEQ